MAGKTNSSITNVAALANVSIATVSRVLSGKRDKDDDIAAAARIDEEALLRKARQRGIAVPHVHGSKDDGDAAIPEIELHSSNPPAAIICMASVAGESVRNLSSMPLGSLTRTSVLRGSASVLQRPVLI